MSDAIDRENKGEVLSPPLLLISHRDRKKRYTFSYFKDFSHKRGWRKYHSQQIQKNLNNIVFDKDIMVAIDHTKDLLYLYDLFTMETLFKTKLDIGHNSILLTYPPPRTLQVVFSGDRTIVKSVISEKIDKVIVIHGKMLDTLSVFDVRKKELSSKEIESGVPMESDYAISGDYLYYILRKEDEDIGLWRVHLFDQKIPRENISLGKEITPESVFILPSGELGVQIREENEFRVIAFQDISKNFEYKTIHTIDAEYDFITGEKNDLLEFLEEGIVLRQSGKVLIPSVIMDLEIVNMHTLYDGRLIFTDDKDPPETRIITKPGTKPLVYPIHVENVYPVGDITVLTGNDNKVWILDNKNRRNGVPDLEEIEKSDVIYVIYMKDNLKWKIHVKCVLETHTKLLEVISSDLLGVISKYL